MSMKKIFFGSIMLLGIACVLAACTSTEPTTLPDTSAPAPCPTEMARPDLSICPRPVVADVPNEEAWAASAHSDESGEPFRHWDADDPQEIPVGCAKCHADTGFMDFLGADDSQAGKVDAAQPVSQGITCTTCHNAPAAAHSSVLFPSGIMITNLGTDAVCMECHQGRASKLNIDSVLSTFNVSDQPDTVPGSIQDGDTERKLGFVNVHYYAAAATLYGSQAKGGYEYDGKTYELKNEHVAGYATCTDCHDAHSLKVKVDQCARCHADVTNAADLKNIRMISSSVDYDGDGSTVEGIAGEIAGLQEILVTAIQAYALEAAGTGIVYDARSYPYFIADADSDGVGDKTEAGGFAAYPTWTGRLLKAAYNYHVSVKDPGAYAHGSKYIIQLLYDSIEDLNTSLAAPLDITNLNRDDAGHFAGSLEAFRHWDDADYMVAPACAKCHTAGGLPAFIHNNSARLVDEKGTTITIGMSELPASNGFNCATCHNLASWPELYPVASVVFPGGTPLSLAGIDTDGLFVVDSSNICLHCHQGNESTRSVDVYLGDKEADTVDAKLTFKNVHYGAAGATLFGSEAAVGYQYAGQTYAGLNDHPDNKCLECHDMHTLKIDTDRCAACHGDVTSLEAIRVYPIDYDGDGDVTEGIHGEITSLTDALYEQIQAYAVTTAAAPIVYIGNANPYFFLDADSDGNADLDRKGALIRYNAFTPRLLRAAYNYQFALKDPGAYVHNPAYVIQLLVDSLADLGGDVTAYTRP